MNARSNACWVRAYEKGFNYLDRLGGVDWIDAPLPRRLHRCKPQVRGCFGFSLVERCACGSARYGGKYWFDRNSRRRSA